MTIIDVPRTGRYDSDDGRTTFEWSLPDWSALDHKLCSLGLHIASRDVVVKGYISYFTPIKHLYCACGRKRWMWFDGGIVSTEDSEPNGHLEWVRGHLEMQAMFAEQRARERKAYESHPCWGEPYKCISCGCSEETPCVSHKTRERVR